MKFFYLLFSGILLSLLINCNDDAPATPDIIKKEDTKQEYSFIYKDYDIKNSSYFKNKRVIIDVPTKLNLMNDLWYLESAPVDEIHVEVIKGKISLKTNDGFKERLNISVKNDSIFSDKGFIGKIDLEKKKIILHRYYLSFQNYVQEYNLLTFRKTSELGELKEEKAFKLSPFDKITDISNDNYLFFSNVDYFYSLKE